MTETAEIFCEFKFEAAHRLPNVPTDHKCSRLHGHSYQLQVHVKGPVDDRAGWVIDFAHIKDACKPVIDRLDHYYLNEIPGLENPTSERLAAWIWNELAGVLADDVCSHGARNVHVWVRISRTEFQVTMSALPDVQSSGDDRGIDIDEVGVGGLRYPVTFDDGDLTQSGIADFEMTVSLPADRRGTHMSRMVQAVAMYLKEINPYELQPAFKAIAGLLDAAELRISLSLPVATNVRSPASANCGCQVHDLSLRGQYADGAFLLSTTITTDVTTLCPCSKAISDYGAHNQRSRVSLSVEGQDDLPYPVPASGLVELIRDASSCPVFPVVKRPDERAITMAAYDNPKFVEDLVRDLSASCREREVSHQIRARNIESIHSHDAVARLSWSRLAVC